MVIDEYLAVPVLRGRWPSELSEDERALPRSSHRRPSGRSTAIGVASSRS